MLTQKHQEHCLSGSIEPIQDWRWQFPGFHHYWWRDGMSLPKARVKKAVHGVAMWIPHWKMSSRHSPHQVKWCALLFGIRNGVTLLYFLEQTINSDCYIAMLTVLKASTSSIRLEKIFFLLQHNNVRPHTIWKRSWNKYGPSRLNCSII